ncbi:DDE-type integrase/transposase/recombinase [Elizabethkingia anophelis]|nr:DDE-type integrase/transposase/recombinase [Elizabethkingia anophelis]
MGEVKTLLILLEVVFFFYFSNLVSWIYKYCKYICDSKKSPSSRLCYIIQNPNLIKELIITGAEQLWISGITYIKTVQGFSYLSFITDAYSIKIVGYSLHPTLETVSFLKALEMTISNWKKGYSFYLIHHSDRIIQYCCNEYTNILRQHGIAISMTQNGNPYDNALAEIVNGALKNEFYPKRVYQPHRDTSKNIDRIIRIYNKLRPHASLDFQTPEKEHYNSGEIKRRWGNYSRKPKSAIEEL